MGVALIVRGAREHNLKNITVSLPHDRLTVVTGPSGSGKSTLAFDTIYAEGHRRYVESLDRRARQALSQLPKPDVDLIEGLRPAIAIPEYTPVRSPRSTVGTLTEVYDYLRVLFASEGEPHCPTCDRVVRAHTSTQVVEELLALPADTRLSVLAPVVRGEARSFRATFEHLRQQGFARVRIDGSVAELESTTELKEGVAHDIEVVIDRLSIRDGVRPRLAEAVELAFSLAQGRAVIAMERGDDRLFTNRYECPEGHAVLEELSARTFSFASSLGACRQCDGLGIVLPAALKAAELAKERRDEELLDLLDRDTEAFSEVATCSVCEGSRLSPQALAVRVAGRSITEAGGLSLPDLRAWLIETAPNLRETVALRPVMEAADDRLAFLIDVGLGYLNISRASRTLSSGEGQRVRLATQIGAGLSGVLYVLDEPTAGLHPADTTALLATLHQLRDRGNTLVVVEHDPIVMRAADHLIDLGPGPGELGGEVVAEGSVARLGKSITSDYLSGRRSIAVPNVRRQGQGVLRVRGASSHNLKNLSVEFKRAALNCVTGVSGSGKSSLVFDELLPAAKHFVARGTGGGVGAVEGLGPIARVAVVDSSPIGRSARSTPATYVGVLDHLRKLFAALPEARARGYSAGRFSFNIKGGRCEACGGDGVQTLRMHLLPDAEITCEVCKGRRYNRETLAVKYRGANIADVLALDVSTALQFFEAVPDVQVRLSALESVGLGYLQLDRRATTLSGGEAQRLKLARDLASKRLKNTLYILDEPTRGLHFVDVERLLRILHGLVERDHTVIVIEHHLDVIKNADHVVDLGPGAGPEGGALVVQGAPEEVRACAQSVTGRFL